MIKAKPTLYKNVLFRSQLESRWAFFLDSWGIAWKYEPRQFITDRGGYVPDFYLPDLQMWVEVKPTTLSEAAIQKLMDVSSYTGERALLFEGNPQSLVRMIEHCGDMQALHLYKGLHVVKFKLGGAK